MILTAQQSSTPYAIDAPRDLCPRCTAVARMLIGWLAPTSIVAGSQTPTVTKWPLTIGRPPGVPPDAQSARAQISRSARITAIVLRSLSIGVLLALTWRVSSPQSETIWTAYETPGDLVRLILGLAVCLWLVVHLFILPRDESGYRSWLYLGFIVVPLGLILTVAIW
jgi:hypothetical protein